MMNIDIKVCLVCSAGGHFSELHALAEVWLSYNRIWVTFDTDDTVYHLKNEKVYFAFHPTIRNLKNFIKNMYLAYTILKTERPHCIISTGAGIAVPFIFIGRILKIQTIYIESMTRVEKLSLTGKLVYYVSDHFLGQWPELSRFYKRVSYKGQVL